MPSDSENPLISSEEGQRSVREYHAEAMKVIRQYPTIHQFVHDDRWAEDYLQKVLKSNGHVGDGGGNEYPELYFAPYRIERNELPQDYLARVETALSGILRKNLPKRNRADLLGGLRDGTAGHVFEVILAWAFFAHFGEDRVQPYPLISPGEPRTADFALETSDGRVLIEATVYLDDAGTAAQNRQAMSSGLLSWVTQPPSRIERRERIIRKCEGKLQGIPYLSPVVLCMNQQTKWPLPEEMKETLQDWVESATSSSHSALLGVACFLYDRFKGFIRPQTGGQGNRVFEQTIQELIAALSALSS